MRAPSFPALPSGIGARAGALLCLCALACSGEPEPARLAPGAPIVVVVVDTLRADALGLYGSAHPTSDELDLRARSGAVFEHAFAPAPWTLPSIGSLVTGRYPAQHGAGRRKVPQPDGSTKQPFVGLDPAAPRLSALLAAHGYATAAFATNSFLLPFFGFAEGFDTFDAGHSKQRDERRADAMVDRALSWIDAREPSKPWFLLLHLIDPHLPYDPPPAVAGRFTAGYHGALKEPVEPDVRDKLDSGALLIDDADRAFLRGIYDEEVTSVAAQLARFLDALEERGVLARGLVFVTADHGEEFFDHGAFEHGHTLYQELLRVPLVVWGAGVRPGRHVEPVSLVDVLPTVLDALGFAPGVELDGVELDGASLWPLLGGGEAPGARALLAENTLYGDQRRALVQWPYKLIADVERPGFELYDLEHDPHEREDLAPSRAELAARLASELAAHAEAGPARAGAAIDEETQHEMNKLGYGGDRERGTKREEKR